MKAFSISWLSKNVINLWTTTWIIQESQKMGMDTSQKFWESHYFGQFCVCVSLDPSLTHTYSWMNRYQYQNKQINNLLKGVSFDTGACLFQSILWYNLQKKKKNMIEGFSRIIMRFYLENYMCKWRSRKEDEGCLWGDYREARIFGNFLSHSF